MAEALQEAISELMREAIDTGIVLNVADAAERLAKEYGGDSREIADQITEAGLHAGINMNMNAPKAG